MSLHDAICGAVSEVMASQTKEIVRLRGEKAELQRQLAEVTAERDQLKTALALADALRNHEKGFTK